MIIIPMVAQESQNHKFSWKPTWKKIKLAKDSKSIRLYKLEVDNLLWFINIIYEIYQQK